MIRLKAKYLGSSNPAFDYMIGETGDLSFGEIIFFYMSKTGT